MVTLSIAVTDWTTLGVAPASGYLKFQLVSPVLNAGTGQIQSTAPWTIAVDSAGLGSGSLPTVPTGNALIVTSRVDGLHGVWYVKPPLTDLNLADLLTNYQVDPTSLLPVAPPASWVTALNAETARATAAEIAAGPFFVGKSDMKYRTLLGTLRNVGAPDYWQPISDSAHVPTGIASVETTTTAIIVNYDFMATAIGSVVAVTDESMAKKNYFVGASVAKDSCTLTISRRFGVSDYVSYNGSAWTSANGTFTGFAYSAGVLTLTHDEVRGPNNAQISPRGGVYIPTISAAGSPASSATETKIEFYDYAGTLQTTPNTNMRAFVQRSDVGGVLNPQLYPVTADAALSNIWLIGIHEYDV